MAICFRPLGSVESFRHTNPTLLCLCLGRPEAAAPPLPPPSAAAGDESGGDVTDEVDDDEAILGRLEGGSLLVDEPGSALLPAESAVWCVVGCPPEASPSIVLLGVSTFSAAKISSCPVG